METKRSKADEVKRNLPMIGQNSIHPPTTPPHVPAWQSYSVIPVVAISQLFLVFG
jgi:hypothetical protein